MHVERINMYMFIKLLHKAILKTRVLKACSVFFCLMHGAVVSQNDSLPLNTQVVVLCK